MTKPPFIDFRLESRRSHVRSTRRKTTLHDRRDGPRRRDDRPATPRAWGARRRAVSPLAPPVRASPRGRSHGPATVRAIRPLRSARAAGRLRAARSAREGAGRAGGRRPPSRTGTAGTASGIRTRDPRFPLGALPTELLRWRWQRQLCRHLPSSEPVHGTRAADHRVRRARRRPGSHRPRCGGQGRDTDHAVRGAARRPALGLDDGPEPLAHDQAHQLLHVRAAAVPRDRVGVDVDAESPGTTGHSCSPSSTDSHTSRSSRSRSDAIRATGVPPAERPAPATRRQDRDDRDDRVCRGAAASRSRRGPRWPSRAFSRTKATMSPTRPRQRPPTPPLSPRLLLSRHPGVARRASARAPRHQLHRTDAPRASADRRRSPAETKSLPGGTPEGLSRQRTKM